MHLCEPFLSGAPHAAAYFGAPCTTVEERCVIGMFEDASVQP